MVFTRYLNLHWKMHFPAIYILKHPKFQHFQSLRPNYSVHLCKTKTSEILLVLFMIQLLKINLNPKNTIRSSKKIMCICYFIDLVVKIVLYLHFLYTKNNRLWQIKKKHEWWNHFSDIFTYCLNLKKSCFSFLSDAR